MSTISHPTAARPTARHAGGIAILALLLNLAPAGRAAPLGTEFVYQGRLDGPAGPATGRYDFTFALHTGALGGSAVVIATNLQVAVTNGVFTTAVDFGAGIYNGTAYWLELGVRSNGVAAFTPLQPRQALTATPNAHFASLAAAVPGGSITASKLAVDSVTTAALQNNSVTGAKIADGAISASDVNPASFAGTFWKADGNAGTIAGPNFVGTTDNQPLELKVGGTRALRIEPHGTSAPSLTGGICPERRQRSSWRGGRGRRNQRVSQLRARELCVRRRRPRRPGGGLQRGGRRGLQ